MSRQIPLHPRHAADSHQPQILQPLPRPCKINNRKIGLHPHNRDTGRIQHVDPMARGRRYVPVSGQLDAIGDTILAEEEGARVREPDASVHDVEGVVGLAVPGDVV